MRIRRSSMLYRRDYLNIYILNVGWPAPDPITWNVLPPLAPSAVKSGPDSPGRTRQSSLPSASEYIDDGYFVPAGLLFPVLVFFSPCVHEKLLQSRPTLWDPVDRPGSSVHGILQSWRLEWVAMPSSKGSSQPEDHTCVSYVSYIGRLVLYH